MVKLDVSVLRYLTREHFRVLTAIEMGMKNHELVPTQLINSIAQLKHGGTTKAIAGVHKHKLVYHERQVYDGYRLTYAGYDYLSLHARTKRDVLASLGNQIGMGKESDVYIAAAPDGQEYAAKFHRLGRTSFRTVKKNRDYLRNRRTSSWLYLSRLAALKEFAFMKVLHAHGFPVPRPIDVNRHVVVMELLQNHAPLSQVRELRDPAALFGKLMDLLIRLAEAGLIHGDFNEFNLLIHHETEEPVMIDFPQMVSTSHPNAAEQFQRDVACLQAFFLKRFKFQAHQVPDFAVDIQRHASLDIEVEASGFTRDQAQEFDELMREQAILSDEDNASSSSSDTSECVDVEDTPERSLTSEPSSNPEEPQHPSVERTPKPEDLQEDQAFQLRPETEEDGLGEETEFDQRRIVSQRVRAQLQKQRQRHKVAARNNYKGREKRKLREEANAWASEKSYSGW